MDTSYLQVIKTQATKVIHIAAGKIKQWFEAYKTYYKKSAWYKKTGVIIATSIVLFITYLFLVDINFLWLFGKSPGYSDVSAPMQNVASEIYTADGKLLGKYYKENRIPVTSEEISPILKETLISTEDIRFYQHFGIDIKGIFAATKDMIQGNARGASTITQQLAKNMFKVRSQYSTGLLGYIPGVKMLIMKSKEWILALKLETFYSKDEILTMYFNTVDFGSNTYGIKTASKNYFDTTPKDITIEQAATLVGLLKATTTYNPRLNPEASLIRRNIVLSNLQEAGHITKAEFDSIKQIPIKLHQSREKNEKSFAPYFRAAVAESLENWCKENDIDLYSDGLKIYTTLDSHMQEYAESAVDKQMRIVQRNFNSQWGKENPWQDENRKELPMFIETLAKRTSMYKDLEEKFSGNQDSIDFYMNQPRKIKVFDYDTGSVEMEISAMDSIRYMQRFMHTGFLAMEPQTGFVKAWVGDINFDSWQYDKVESKRQPGSTFKLFVYTEAMNQGLSPCDIRVDRYVDWELTKNGSIEKWVPHNADGAYSGDTMSLKAAFARSVNSIAVEVAKEAGIKNIIRTAHAMGIKTELEETPSLSLGASDVSLLELINSYCTVINEGMAHDPVLVTRIEDRNGKILFQYNKTQVQALSYETAFLMTEMLKSGMTEPGGTTRALWGFNLFNYNTEFGGKTGTSSNHSDAWFVGVTPKLVAGAWVGGEHRSIHFKTGAFGQGSRTALPIFGYFMEKVLADKNLTSYRAKFPAPKKPINRNYQCQSVYKAHNDSTEVSTDSLNIETEEIPEVIEE
ncbi:transglycosylase domain-containing protein [Dysgonomonas macrotermitis]|uniref:Penicillin-binding protein 1A n=1 Tax=Dysgonomonas macrotermitis TaxID=1346286 RepID=A0A1M4X124_9BACT|nr:transglycosylase domain-containing protein [Dysgonomonas macrotermitis]SHE87184.1 penicillin-binding protein 1A [Dysgonomonas macrotermitis]